MAQEDLERFRELVLEDPRLMSELLVVRDVDRFTALVVACAGERGLRVEPGDVAAAMRGARRDWAERWL